MLATQTLLNFSDAERPLGERLLKLAAETDRIEGYREPHATEIARLAEKLGQRLGLHGHDLSALKFAALAHDLGERSMKRDYLLRPGSLTWEEQLDLWRHPIIGEQAAAELKLPRLTQLLIRWHHEWWNGQGYPDGLSGTAIPLGARILRLVDTYCALLANRPYRGKLELPTVEQFIADQAGVEADPQVVKEFLALLDEERPASVPPTSVPIEATADFASAEETDLPDYYTTAPPAAEEPSAPDEIPALPLVSAWDLARQETTQPAPSWQGLTPTETQESWPTTHGVPAPSEEEAASGESEVELTLTAPTVEFVAAEPVDEPLTELQTAPIDNASLELPNELLEELDLPTEVSAPTVTEVTIVSLSDAPDYFWPVAQWLYEQWWVLPGSTINVVSDQLKEHLAGQPLPSTLVAVVDGQPVGSISLHEYAIPDRPDLTPSLAALYVRPEYRHHGIASRLLEAAEARLREIGAARLYFTVPEQEDFFAKRGWQVLEPAVGAQTLIVLVKE
jgi:GNAT superfamily N-acetyltransferase